MGRKLSRFLWFVNQPGHIPQLSDTTGVDQLRFALSGAE